jgi:hypothetical protein
MTDKPTDAEVNFADWIIPLNEASLVSAPLTPESNLPVAEGTTPELLQFPTDSEAYPTEGHHPRLMRFGRVA